MRRSWRKLEYGALQPPPSLGLQPHGGEPIWQLFSDPLEGGERSQDEQRGPDSIDDVAGAFLVQNTLTPNECATLIGLTEALGFTEGTSLVEVPRTVRSNDVVVVVVSQQTAHTLSARLAQHVPRSGHAASKRTDPVFVNRRWRCYRYKPPDPGAAGQQFGPHYDGAQPLSGVRDGRLVDEEPAPGVRRLSQMSVLLYLNDGHAGGDTIFYPTGEVGDGAASVRVAPRAGAALCFWHGDHPLSPLHQGAPLDAQTAVGSPCAMPKYVIRTEVMYATEATPALSDSWSSSSYARAMLLAASKS